MSVLSVIGGQEGPVCDLSDALLQAVPVGQGGGQAEGFPPPSYAPNQEVFPSADAQIPTWQGPPCLSAPLSPLHVPGSHPRVPLQGLQQSQAGLHHVTPQWPSHYEPLHVLAAFPQLHSVQSPGIGPVTPHLQFVTKEGKKKTRKYRKKEHNLESNLYADLLEELNR